MIDAEGARVRRKALRDQYKGLYDRLLVHEEFVRWFDADTAGPVERYKKVASRIWTEVC